MGIGDFGLWIGGGDGGTVDWGLGIADWGLAKGAEGPSAGSVPNSADFRPAKMPPPPRKPKPRESRTLAGHLRNRCVAGAAVDSQRPVAYAQVNLAKVAGVAQW